MAVDAKLKAPNNEKQVVMGGAKAWMMEQEERGYDFVEGNICADCFTDETIKQYVKDCATAKKCDYCGKRSKKTIAAEFDEVMGIIVKGIALDWNDPNPEGILYDGREGGFQAPLTDTYDLISEYEITEKENVFDTILNSINNSMWVEREFYVGPINERLMYGWAAFSREVKEDRESVSRPPDPEERFGPEIHPTEFLGSLGRIISEYNEELDIVKPLPKGSKIYRIRIKNVPFTTAKELGAPPVAAATQPNRMSPAGTSMFYGAFDEKTAFLETYVPTMAKKGQIISVGTFSTLRPMLVLDLGNLLKIPSVFNIDSQYLIKPLRFFHDFASEIAQPIARDGREHIEYIPTQVVTEFFRDSFSYAGEDIGGIIYKSSRFGGKTACVIFCGNYDACEESEADKANYFMQLDRVEHKKAADYE